MKHLQRFSGSGMTSDRTRERLLERLRQRGIEDRVLESMRKIPRHIFIDEALAHRAYEDNALQISRNQTISQPYMVGLMTQLAIAKGRPQKVLEVGTGSGYQAAIISLLADKVYTVERIGSLHHQARSLIAKLKLGNIYFKFGDGNLGWSEKGPFDSIIVTAGGQQVSPVLLQQLAEDGRMIIPLGDKERQHLYCFDKKNGEITRECLDPVKFVPLRDGQVD